jgi:hypothetical protein
LAPHHPSTQIILKSPIHRGGWENREDIIPGDFSNLLLVAIFFVKADLIGSLIGASGESDLQFHEPLQRALGNFF